MLNVLQALLKHDKPMHRKAGITPHLRHVPAYLKDPAAVMAAQKAAAGAAAAAAAQRRPKDKTTKGSKRQQKRLDPLKAAGETAAAGMAGVPASAALTAGAAGAAQPAANALAGSVFKRAPKKGGSAVDEELTEIEQRALTNPIKLSKAKVLAGVGGAALKAKVLGPKVAAMAANKHNVKKTRPTMGAGAKRRR